VITGLRIVKVSAQEFILFYLRQNPNQ